MKAKRILSIAIIAALPFGAHATDPVVAVGPAHASSNPVVATANAPYVTVTPTQADESHIATTAYVKGAYNDAIAAVNKVDETVGEQIDNVVEQFQREDADLYEALHAEIENTNSSFDDKQNKFILVSNQSSGVSEYVLDKSAFSNEIRNGYVASVVSEDSSLVTAGAVADVFASQRATIYTTWDTNATTQVPLSFVPVQP